MPSSVGWDIECLPQQAGTLVHIGRVRQYLVIELFAAEIVNAFFITVGAPFQSFAASTWKLCLDFESLQESLKILFFRSLKSWSFSMFFGL